MSVFKLFNKKQPDLVTLPEPDDSLSFFETIRSEREKFWADTLPDKGIYRFQIQPATMWRPGLSDTELQEFERAMGFSFPAPLWNFYKTMNGLTKPGSNLYGNDGTLPVFRPLFYAFPDNIPLIKEQIECIYAATCIKEKELKGLGISKIFPVFQHRFMLVDHLEHPILSMCGDDIIYWAENLSKLLATEIFQGVIYNIWDFESPPQAKPEIRFWVD